MITGGITMGKAVKINITLPDEALAQIDSQAKEQRKTRSGLILEALQLFLRRCDEERAERERRLRIKKACVEIRRLRDKAGEWDGVAEVRKWRDAR
jgi:metal-responsive CopG/Arc/MetJ family transcriptional regulator